MGEKMEIGKSYRALRHEHTRKLQRDNSTTLHHPDEKINQIHKALNSHAIIANPKILELFGGVCNLTKEYSKLGQTIVIENDQKKVDHLKSIFNDVEVIKADSFIKIYEFLSSRKTFEIIDADPYGFPNRLFPHLFLLMENSLLFLTVPKPSVNILNGITQTHLTCYYGSSNPSLEDIIGQISVWGLCHWRKVELIDHLDLKSVWRFCFSVEKVKATEYTGVKNNSKHLTLPHKKFFFDI